MIGAQTLEDLVGRLLRWGVTVAAVVIAAGLLLLVPAGTGKRALLAQLLSEHEVLIEGLPTTLRAVVAGAMRARPVPVIDLGLLLLILTPVLRVAVAAVFFVRRGDTRYSVIGLVVLGLLLTSFLLGKIT